MDILYFFSNPAMPEGNELIAARRYDAVYTDSAAERAGLAACLDALKKGDVLHIARETHLGDELADVVELLADLARRGVDVHVGRTGATLHAESSPYLPLTADVVRACSAFVNAKCRHCAVQGIKRARAACVSYLYEGARTPKDGFLPRINPDAAYRDSVDYARPQLASCLASLKPGDTLCVLRETHLADDFGQAVELLKQLARRGVHVRLGSAGRLIRSEGSPFLRLSAEAAAAIVKFRQAFTARKAREGFQRRIARGERVGRPRSPLPEGFAEARAAWLEGRMTGRKAAAQCGMASSTFAKRARA